MAKKPGTENNPRLLPSEMNVELTHAAFDKIMSQETSTFRVFVRSLPDKYFFVFSGLMLAVLESFDALIIFNLTKYLKGLSALDRAAMRHLARYPLFIAVTGVLNTLFYTFPYFVLQKNVVAFRGNIIVAIVKRILTLNSGFASSSAAGNVANLIQLDCSNMITNVPTVINVFYYVFLLITNVSLCFYLVGWTCVSYIGIFLVLSPLPFYAVYKISFYDREFFELKDKRMSLLMSVFSNIRFIKFNVLENFFVRLAHDYRLAELGILRKTYYAVLVNSMVIWLLPGLAQICFTWTWLLFVKQARAEVFMGSLKLFSSINRIFGIAPWTLQGVNNYRLIFRRLNAFFNLARPTRSCVQHVQGGPLAVEISGSFSYANESAVQFLVAVRGRGPAAEERRPPPEFELNVDFRVRKGETVFVVGKIGSGKSSLVRALLGDLKARGEGFVRLDGRVAYCPQTPFLLSKTVRDNIVFYRGLCEERLLSACRRAHLDHDLKLRSISADKQLIENGMNISGGQRMRVNLARCFYEARDIYIFDDPFSSLDLNVGQGVFEAMQQGLAGSTKIIITHAVNVLKGAERVVYLDKGEIAFDGSYDAFLETPFAEEIFSIGDAVEEEDEEAGEGEETVELAVPVHQPRKTSVKRQERLVPRVEPPVWQKEPARKPLLCDDINNKRQLWRMVRLLHKYYGASGGLGLFTLAAYAGTFLLYHVTVVAYDFLSADEDKRPATRRFLARFSLLSFAPILLIWLRFCFVCYMAYRTSRRLLEKMLLRTVHADLTGFFDKVDLARLSTRFSTDLDNIDGTFDYKVSEATILPAYVLVDIVVSCRTVSAYTLLLYALYFGYCFYLQNVFVPLRSDLNGLERLTANPIVNLVYDIVKGARLIDNFGVSARVVEEMVRRVNDSSEVLFRGAAVAGWFDSRVNYVNVFLVQLVPMAALLLFGAGRVSPDDLSVYVLYLTGFGWNFFTMLQALSDLETSMKSLERCDGVLDVPVEPDYSSLRENERFVAKQLDGPARLFVPRKRPNADRFSYDQINVFGFDRRLFHAGRIVFEGVSARYAPALPPVIRDFSLVIDPGCKVGICGKTGSGKSTLVKLLAAYLRPHAGRIAIDDYDLASLNLKALRSEFVIVNQEITLFKGSLRENLNPEVYGQRRSEAAGEGLLTRMFDAAAEREIVDMLVELGFKEDKLAAAGLDLQIESDGGNLSPGERQLVVFFRAMCSDRRIVILDEATSSVDVETERRLMDYFHAKVQGKTVIIIAHRINTIINCDRIVVMQSGEIREVGAPSELLENPLSLFKEYYEKTLH